MDLKTGKSKSKSAFHLAALCGLTVAVFLLDQLFSSLELDTSASSLDLLVALLLVFLAAQAYAWRRPIEVKQAQAALHHSLEGLSTAAELRRAVKSYEMKHGPPDAVSYNLVLRSYAREARYTEAEQWLLEMERKKRATVCSYNTMLDACAKSSRPPGACEEWLQRMLDRGLRPNVISFSTVIHAFAREGDATTAALWQEKMLKMGIEPDTVSYNSLIHACGVKGNIRSAEAWLEDMLKRELAASVTTFASLIDACAKAGDLERAEKWMKEMLDRGIQPNVVSFGAVINACAKACNLKRAEHWHQRMLDMGVRPNLRSYSAVINACAKAGKADEAERWLTKLEDQGLKSDTIVYSSVIDACGKAGDSERAMEVFQRMRLRGIKPHLVTYSALARPFAYRGQWREVEELALQMQSEGHRANDYFIYAQLLAYATAKPKQSERAELCMREAVESGVLPNEHMFNGLSRAVGRKRAHELCQELGHSF